ncbi:MAG: alpha/beta fold hydrolase [Actinomycetota bacterium]
MEPVDVETLRFRSADGTELEGDRLTPAEPAGAAVVCHPHPLYGGSRNDAVVAAISRTLVGAGFRILRFDFRGTGGSSGSHGFGSDERLDVQAAIDEAALPDQPFVLAGYSFGADVALSIADPRIDRWIVAAPVLSVFSTFAAASDPRPKTLVAAAHDQFKPAEALAVEVRDWAATEVVTVDAADHFFGGRYRPLEAAVSAALG